MKLARPHTREVNIFLTRDGSHHFAVVYDDLSRVEGAREVGRVLTGVARGHAAPVPPAPAEDVTPAVCVLCGFGLIVTGLVAGACRLLGVAL